jgi:SRSO17 transposase
MDARWEFQSTCHACGARSEPRLHCLDSMVGPCSTRERQAMEPIALGVEGGTLRGMPRCVREVRWAEAQRRWNDPQRVADTLGAPDGVRICAETGFAKQGSHAGGVARPSCGSLGTVEQGQVGVLAAYASRQGSALVAKRFVVPAAWCNDTQAARRAACQVPKDLPCHPQPPVAAAMLQARAREGRLPCKSLVAECLDGHSPACLEAIDAWVGVTACVAIPSETRGGLPRPPTAEHMDRSKGKAHAQRVVATTPDACPVAAVAAHLPASRWDRRTVSDGPKGPLA